MSVFFSVVIPLYNKERDVENTIESVLKQLFSDFEIIIVNDGSSDNSARVIEQIGDDRIHLLNTPNRGAAAARNTAVEKSNGKYVVFLDGDDYWYPAHLQTLFVAINKFPLGKWFGVAYELEHNDRLRLAMKSPIMDFGTHWVGEISNFFENSMIDCLAWTSAICMRKDFFKELGGFNTNYDTGQDTDLWIRAALTSNLIFSNRITARYILTASNRLTNKCTLLKRHMNVDAFAKEEANNIWLKKYMDLIRYSYAIKFKIAGLTDMYLACKNAISYTNLSKAQRFLLNSSKIKLIFLLKAKSLLERYGLRLRIPRVN